MGKCGTRAPTSGDRQDLRPGLRPDGQREELLPDHAVDLHPGKVDLRPGGERLAEIKDPELFSWVRAGHALRAHMEDTAELVWVTIERQIGIGNLLQEGRMRTQNGFLKNQKKHHKGGSGASRGQ